MRLSTFISVLGMAISFVTASIAEPAGIDCAARVIDRASLLEQPTDRTRIEAASERLVKQGAYVHVLTSEEDPEPTMRDVIAACPSWQTSDGAAKDKLILLAMSAARQKGAFLYGSGWGDALDDHWLQIRRTYLSPHVGDHGLADGFVAAEQEISRQIRTYQQTARERSNRHKHWFTICGLLAAACFAIFFAREWSRAQQTRKAETLANAELQDAFREWINDELIKVNITLLHDRSHPRQKLRDALESAKHYSLAPDKLNKEWNELKRMLECA